MIDLTPYDSLYTRYFLELSYDGTHFSGWQTQKNNPTIQQTIEEALTILCRAPQQIVGCGRTDTGVHALQYFAHWDYSGPIAIDRTFVVKLNSLLPSAIAIHRIFRVDSQVNARYDAISRTYHYFIHTRKDPFVNKYSCECRFHDLDYTLMQQAAELLLQYQDFLPLIKLDREHRKTRCILYDSCWTQISPYRWRYQVSANRFLHNMVRRIVGTCLLVGRGKLTLEQLTHSMNHQSPLPLVLLAPANGLSLVNIQYPEGVIPADITYQL